MKTVLAMNYQEGKLLFTDCENQFSPKPQQCWLNS